MNSGGGVPKTPSGGAMCRTQPKNQVAQPIPNYSPPAGQPIPSYPPPPPPGVAPNAAQIAAAQGKTVEVKKKPNSWVAGGSDGGYNFW